LNGKDGEVDEGTEDLPGRSEADPRGQADPPTQKEVRDSMKVLRKNKAPGADNLSGELLKYGGWSDHYYSLTNHNIWEK
jgi:hypothetical protein